MTVGGFVSELLGRVPATGDVVEHERRRLSVTKASRRRADLVEVQVIDRAGEAVGEASDTAGTGR